MVARTLKRALYLIVATSGVGLVIAALFLLTQTVQKSDDFGRLQNELDSLIGSLMAFFGQTQESMPHESGWYMLTLGRRLERGLCGGSGGGRFEARIRSEVLAIGERVIRTKGSPFTLGSL